MAKSGARTTEFWMTLVGVLITALIAFGVISKEDEQVVRDMASPLIAAIAALVPGLVGLYTVCRTLVKRAESNAEAESARADVALAVACSKTDYPPFYEKDADVDEKAEEDEL